MNIGPQPTSDSPFTAKYRLAQSRYRAEVLKEEFGCGPYKNSTTKYGNFLIDGETTGSNFISEQAFLFAKHKVQEKKINKALTIDAYRLFNNMLSSMPMCFNLFADLRYLLTENQEAATEIAKQLFVEIPWISSLTEVDVEFIPVPIADYTNDKSAFDAMLLVEDEKGRKGLISIETKYTDLLGGNASADSETKNALVKEGDFFTDELRAKLKGTGYLQIHRNFLLTYAYATKNRFEYFANVVISPGEDKKSVDEIEELKRGMSKYQDRIFKIPLEEFVERGCRQDNEHFSEVMGRFRERYVVGGCPHECP